MIMMMMMIGNMKHMKSSKVITKTADVVDGNNGFF
jgi:hypothetical protein